MWISMHKLVRAHAGSRQQWHKILNYLTMQKKIWVHAENSNQYDILILSDI